MWAAQRFSVNDLQFLVTLRTSPASAPWREISWPILRHRSPQGQWLLDLEPFGRTHAFEVMDLIPHPLPEEPQFLRGQPHWAVLVRHRCSSSKVDGRSGVSAASVVHPLHRHADSSRWPASMKAVLDTSVAREREFPLTAAGDGITFLAAQSRSEPPVQHKAEMDAGRAAWPDNAAASINSDPEGGTPCPAGSVQRKWSR